MKLNIVLRSPVSVRPYDDDLYCLPVAAVPYVLGAIRLRMSPYWYSTEDDYARGRSLLAEFSGGLLMGCAQDIVHAINRVEAMIDVSLNGNGRTITGTGTTADPYIFVPALAPEFDPTDYVPPSLRSDANVTRALLDNLVNGTVSAVATDPRSFRDQLEAIRALLEASGMDGEDIEAILNLILLALA
jgi:hypothetical protein